MNDTTLVSQPVACETSACSQLKVSAWNWRGLDKGEPYLHHLAQDHSDIIVVSEHWLWPYDIQRLESIHIDLSRQKGNLTTD